MISEYTKKELDEMHLVNFKMITKREKWNKNCTKNEGWKLRVGTISALVTFYRWRNSTEESWSEIAEYAEVL